MNTTLKLIVQNTNTALQDAGTQYSITIFGNQGDICHEQFPKLI